MLSSSSPLPHSAALLFAEDPVQTSFQHVIDSNNRAMYYMALRAGPAPHFPFSMSGGGGGAGH